jgi:hypothetical protein
MREINSFEESPQEFKDLVKRIENIDKDAAKYLKTEVFNLSEEDFGPTDTLMTCLIFSATPQGDGYWWGIVAKLGEEE